jgi:CheY-like chemotaxis protein
MADGVSADLLTALRVASRPAKERYLVGVAAPGERARIVNALAAEGEVVEVPSAPAALERLAEEPFELVVLDGEDPASPQDSFTAAKELRPFSDLVPVLPADPARVQAAFAKEAAAVLVRPFPPSDALFRAHVRYLASCRRARTRALMLDHAIARNLEALRSTEPALEVALAQVLENGRHAPAILALGRPEFQKRLGLPAREGAPDILVVEVDAEDRIDARLREARGRGPGAVFVVVDNAPTEERVVTAIYGGARAYLAGSVADSWGAIVTMAAHRRRAEITGRQLVETLTRFGVMEDASQPVAAVTQDLDAQLIADATAGGPSAVVPSSHEVLVVDDEVVVLTVLREILRRSGYRVTTAASAEEAIALMQARPFDLVLTDKNLPGASGMEVLRVARTLKPPPAVVMITGYSSYDSAAIALDIGALDYIEKPIRDVEALRFRIKRALSRRNEQLERTREEGGESGTRGRILIVELEGTRRRLMTEFLGKEYEVTAAANGDEALAVLKNDRFDLVLADRNLPGMSGLRVIEQARQLLPHCASVLYTAYPSFETVKEAFDLGVDAYLVRPSDDLKTLGEKVAGALRSRGGILLG